MSVCGSTRAYALCVPALAEVDISKRASRRLLRSVRSHSAGSRTSKTDPAAVALVRLTLVSGCPLMRTVRADAGSSGGLWRRRCERSCQNRQVGPLGVERRTPES